MSAHGDRRVERGAPRTPCGAQQEAVDVARLMSRAAVSFGYCLNFALLTDALRAILSDTLAPHGAKDEGVPGRLPRYPTAARAGTAIFRVGQVGRRLTPSE